MDGDRESQATRASVEVEMYPGTEIMRDDIRRSNHHLIHNHNSQASVVLIPQPSSNGDDPLNWTRSWKWIVVVLQVFFIMTSVITALSVSPLTPVFEAQFHKSAEAIALLTSALVIVTGYANLILVPIAEVFGRRFVLILSSVINLGGSLWHGAAQSYGSFMGARIFISLGMSINESLMPMVIGDIFFLHERGRYVGIYFFALFNSMCLGPLIAGACEQHFGTWRTFYWIISSLNGVSALTIIFLHPETKYTRDLTSPTPRGLFTRQEQKIDDADKSTDVEQVESVPEKTVTNTGNSIESGVDLYLGHGRPSRSQFRPIQAKDEDALSKVSRHVVTPFRLLGFPIVLFGAWMLAAPAAGLLAVNYVQSAALMAPPYNFDNSQVGLSNLALVCGGSLGVLTAGPISDWVVMYLTRRNGDIREPEMRLVSMIPFIVLSVIAFVVVGLGFDRHWPWEAVITIGFGGIGLMMVSVSTIGITYAVDCYKPVAGQIMVIATVVKNTLGFGMGYYATGWVEKDGYTPLFMCHMGLVVGPAVLGLVFFSIFGKRLRKLTRHSKVHTY